VNPLKGKQLTNVRASNAPTSRSFDSHVDALEQAIAYIDDDELLEVTPPRAYAQAPLRLNVSGMQEKN
jgi:GTP-binding protein